MGKSGKRKSRSDGSDQSTAAEKGMGAKKSRTSARANAGSKRSSPPQSTAAKKGKTSSSSPQPPQKAGKKRQRSSCSPPDASESAKTKASWEEFEEKCRLAGVAPTAKDAKAFFEQHRKEFKLHRVSGPVEFPENWRDMLLAKEQHEDALTEETYAMVVRAVVFVFLLVLIFASLRVLTDACAFLSFARPFTTQALNLNAQGEQSLKQLCGDDLMKAELDQISTLPQPVLFAMKVVRENEKPVRSSLPANVKKGDLEKLREALDATLSPTIEQLKEKECLINQVYELLSDGQQVIMKEIDSADFQLPPIPKAGKTVVENVSTTTMIPADIGEYLQFANKCFHRDIRTVSSIFSSIHVNLHLFTAVFICFSLTATFHSLLFTMNIQDKTEEEMLEELNKHLLIWQWRQDQIFAEKPPSPEIGDFEIDNAGINILLGIAAGYLKSGDDLKNACAVSSDLLLDPETAKLELASDAHGGGAYGHYWAGR